MLLKVGVLGFASILFISCSVSSGNRTKSVSISLDSASEQLEVVDRDSNTYRLRGSSVPSYLTVIEECDLGQEATATARARQLFVGLENLKIDEQRRFKLDSELVVVTSVSAKLDGADLGLTSYSVQRSNCITDIVLWTQSDETSSDSKIPPLSSSLKTEHDTAVRELIPLILQR